MIKREQGATTLTLESGDAINFKAGAKILAAGTQTAAITAASEAHALNSTFSDTEAEAALNALGAKINLIITALENAGILVAN